MDTNAWNVSNAETGDDNDTSPSLVYTFFTELSPVPLAQTVVELLFYVSAFSMGTIGNLAVLVAVVVDPRLHSPTNYLMANQSASDLLFLMVIPFWTANRWQGQWSAGDALCRAGVYIQYTASSVSIYSLCAIAVERMRSITKNRGVAMTTKQLVIFVVTLWIFSLTISFYSITNVGKKTSEINGRNVTFCSLEGPFDESMAKDGKTGIYLATFVGFLGPLCFLIVVYSKIIRHVRRSLQRMRHHRTATSVARGATLEKKLVLMLFMSALLFFVMWLPSTVTGALIMGRQWADMPSTLLTACSIIAAVNTSVNPILLAIFNSFFRDDLRAFLRCAICIALKEKRAREDVWATSTAGRSTSRVFPLMPRPNDGDTLRVDTGLHVSFKTTSVARGGPSLATSLADVSSTVQTSNAIKDIQTDTESKDMQTRTGRKDTQTRTESNDMQTRTESTDMLTRTESTDMLTRTESTDMLTRTESTDMQTSNKSKDMQKGKENKVLQTVLNVRKGMSFDASAGGSSFVQTCAVREEEEAVKQEATGSTENNSPFAADDKGLTTKVSASHGGKAIQGPVVKDDSNMSATENKGKLTEEESPARNENVMAGSMFSSEDIDLSTTRDGILQKE